MKMTDFDTVDARTAYWNLKREASQSIAEAERLRREVAQKDREIASLRRQIENMRTRRHEFPSKYLPVIEPLIHSRPGVTLDDILRGGGSVGNREPHTLAELRRQCWQAVYQAFPEESFVDIGKAFNRSHTSIWYAVKRGGWKR
ncbi:MAG: hypothetical protein ACK4SQ_14430 [Allorhizobium sp.]